MKRERWPKPRRSSGANQRALLKESGVRRWGAIRCSHALSIAFRAFIGHNS
jgi:hypothetical protein